MKGKFTESDYLYEQQWVPSPSSPLGGSLPSHTAALKLSMQLAFRSLHYMLPVLSPPGTQGPDPCSLSASDVASRESPVHYTKQTLKTTALGWGCELSDSIPWPYM